MPLPILSAPKYEAVIPSTGKKISFRPFLVKEEKILLLAQESDDPKQVIGAIKDIITACTFEKVDVETLAVYDLEYLFLQLRSKSVGEIVDLQMKCKSCSALTPVQINLDDVQVSKPEKINAKVEFTDSVGVTLRPVPVSDISQVTDNPNDFVRMIGLCIESIYDDNKVWHRNDISDKEMTEFVESLSRQQVAKIEAFIASQPRLTHLIKYICRTCGAENSVELKGLQDFF